MSRKESLASFMECNTGRVLSTETALCTPRAGVVAGNK